MLSLLVLKRASFIKSALNVHNGKCDVKSFSLPLSSLEYNSTKFKQKVLSLTFAIFKVVKQYKT